MSTKNSGTLFIIAAPSGAGKTSLVKALSKKTNSLSISTSHTTRQPREDEREGEDYFFIEEKKFIDLVKENYFLEYAKVFDNYYGTSRSLVESEIEAGRNVILEIDWQGAKQVKSIGLEIISIFILPPNYQALQERLLNRKKDNIQTIERRMSAALEEISHYKEFDFIVINDDFEQTLTKLNEIIVSPNTNLHRQSNFYDNFVSQIMAQQD